MRLLVQKRPECDENDEKGNARMPPPPPLWRWWRLSSTKEDKWANALRVDIDDARHGTPRDVYKRPKYPTKGAALLTWTSLTSGRTFPFFSLSWRSVIELIVVVFFLLLLKLLRKLWISILYLLTYRRLRRLRRDGEGTARTAGRPGRLSLSGEPHRTCRSNGFIFSRDMSLKAGQGVAPTWNRCRESRGIPSGD